MRWIDLDVAWARPGSVGAYLVAALAVAFAAALRMVIGPWVPQFTYFPFTIAVIGVTFVSGTRAGFAAIMLTTLAAWLVITPSLHLAGAWRGEPIERYLIFLAIAMLIVPVIGALRMALSHGRALAESLRTVYDANPDAVLVVDANGRIVDCNARALQLFGYAKAALDTMPIEELLPDRFRVGHPAHRAEFLLHPVPRQMGTGTESFGQRSDGTEFPIDVRIGPLQIDGKNLTIATVRDATEQIALTMALTRSHQHRAILIERGRVEEEMRIWADAFENAAFGIAIHDAPAGRIQLANTAFARMLGMTVDEVRESKLLDLYAPSERARIQTWLDAADQTGHVAYEANLRRKDGSEFPVHDDVTSEREDNGTVRYRITSTIDISRRRQAEEALRQAQKMEAIGNIAGGVAHDFNNILAVIIANLDLVAPLVATQPDPGGLVHDALTAALRGADLTQRLLAFARRQPLQSVHLMPNQVVSDLARLLTPLLGGNIAVVLDLAPVAGPISADRAQLEASLTNLAMNARDAMPRGGRLRITTANREIDADHAALHPGLQPGSYAMIEVADTGTGMAPELLSRIFEPFFTTKGFGKGTGLGLSMVFGFTHQSGGYISALSEPGAGATFRLYLPCVSGRAAIQGVTTAAVATPSRGEMVLVVEDDEALRHVVARQLGELGYRVIEAGTALDALAALEANHVDVMFSDVMMPGDMDGLALAGQAVARSPGVRILLTSGFPNAGMGSLEGSLGTSMRLLNKPYRKEELALALRAVLEAEAAWQASKVQPQATPNEFVA